MSNSSIIKLSTKDKRILSLAAFLISAPLLLSAMYLAVCWCFDRHPMAPLSKPDDVSFIYMASAVCDAPEMKFSPTDELLQHRKLVSMKQCDIELRHWQDRLSAGINDEERNFIRKRISMLRSLSDKSL